MRKGQVAASIIHPRLTFLISTEIVAVLCETLPATQLSARHLPGFNIHHKRDGNLLPPG